MTVDFEHLGGVVALALNSPQVWNYLLLFHIPCPYLKIGYGCQKSACTSVGYRSDKKMSVRASSLTWFNRVHNDVVMAKNKSPKPPHGQNWAIHIRLLWLPSPSLLLVVDQHQSMYPALIATSPTSLVNRKLIIALDIIKSFNITT